MKKTSLISAVLLSSILLVGTIACGHKPSSSSQKSDKQVTTSKSSASKSQDKTVESDNQSQTANIASQDPTVVAGNDQTETQVDTNTSQTVNNETGEQTSNDTNTGQNLTDLSQIVGTWRADNGAEMTINADLSVSAGYTGFSIDTSQLPPKFEGNSVYVLTGQAAAQNPDYNTKITLSSDMSQMTWENINNNSTVIYSRVS